MINKRIEWVDIYKGLAILLVVIGHATGLFNAYIYQFHVAAFFFISGYVANMERTSLLKDVYKKIMTLIIPLFTMVLIYAVLIVAARRIGVMQYFEDEGSAFGLFEMVVNFLKSGATVNFLGVSWFVVVLFFASIISHLLFSLSRGNSYVFSLLTCFVYIYGFYNMKSGYSLSYNVDIALVAQGYYGIGYLIKMISKYKTINLLSGTLFKVIVFIGTIFLMVYMKLSLNGLNLMDIANREMPSLLWNTVAVVNGILWLYAFSGIISSIPFARAKDAVIALGRNTMGIMLLHFSFFRVVAVGLYLSRLVSIDELKKLVPSTEVGNIYWGIYVVVAVLGSFLLWRLLSRVPVLRELLGFEKSYINSIAELVPIKQLISTYNKLIYALEESMVMEKVKHIQIIGVIIAIGLMFGARFVPNMYEDIANEGVSGPIKITFPYSGRNVEFGEGWLEQTESESYRWVRQESSFSVNLVDQTSIILGGYVPGDIRVSHMSVYFDENLIGETDLEPGGAISIEYSIDGLISEGSNVFRIEFDGEKVPNNKDTDQRAFSAMFNNIEIR